MGPAAEPGAVQAPKSSRPTWLLQDWFSQDVIISQASGVVVDLPLELVIHLGWL